MKFIKKIIPKQLRRRADQSNLLVPTDNASLKAGSVMTARTALMAPTNKTAVSPHGVIYLWEYP